MLHQFSRNELAIGKEGLALLQNKCVAVIGVGGVGSFAAETLARSGIGTIILVDKDTIDITNVNRQIHALLSTVGELKVEVMQKRIADINPDCQVITKHMFFLKDTKDEFFDDVPKIDFIIDAADVVFGKEIIIEECLKRNIPFISSMAMANKMDPTQLEITDLSKTTYDPIAKVIRYNLRKRKVYGKIPVVFSKETPIVPRADVNEVVGKADSPIRKVQMPPSSNAMVPTVAGILCASFVINTLLADVDIQRKK
ncbi:tRNA threonylcarbamoyladenosine dehydratase [Culicoidibacter larvae]|uniref:tRNA threonylcarbamoyladenosine dehydratase n=1 Tax=Culicoidibacter larvae TaxID=2579976 RepID=A0A5R8QGN4_9FIRM|nr:tRNA threonylcarbamoyladenosine dehydratase [Culicoidibacter larvae]TLG76623.1 tRNA threonylcarbamoyladenosine dehydratase [Culicoidibacter larvae]